MNLRQLEYFVSVSETLNFTKTAEEFFISQTAVTQQIQALEKHLDVKLLNRNKRSVELTPAGSIFLVEAKAILARMDNAIKRTKETSKGFSGILTLGIQEGYEELSVAENINKFCSNYPNISLSITEATVDTLYKKLIHQEIDVVININTPKSYLSTHDINYKTISSYKLLVHMPSSHPLAFRNSIDLSELKNETFIFTGTQLEHDNFGHYESTLDHFLRMGFSPRNIVNSESFRTTALMVAANIGIALLPSYALNFSPTLLMHHTIIPLTERADIVEMVIAHSDKNENPTIDKFLNFF